MKDDLVRGTAWDGKLRVFAVTTTGLVNELRRTPRYLSDGNSRSWPYSDCRCHDGRHAEGRGEATIQVKGDGPIGQIVVDANATEKFAVMSDYPHVHLASNALGKLDVAGAVGRTGYHPYY